MSSVLNASALDAQNERNDLDDACIESVDFDRDERLSEGTNGLETFLVVTASTTNKDADLVCDEEGLYSLRARMMLLKVAVTLVKLAITTTNNEILPSGLGLPRWIKSTEENDVSISKVDQIDGGLTDRLGVSVSLSLSENTRELSGIG